MAARNLAYGTRTAFGSVTNINSLANNAAKPLAQVDNATSVKALDYLLFVQATLASSGVSTTGTIEIYLLEAQASGAGNTTDGIDMATPATTDQAANIKNAKLLAVLAANASGQVVRWQGRLRDFIADVPNFFSLLIVNKSGAAIAATGNDAQYVAITETIA